MAQVARALHSSKGEMRMLTGRGGSLEHGEQHGRRIPPIEVAYGHESGLQLGSEPIGSRGKRFAGRHKLLVDMRNDDTVIGPKPGSECEKASECGCDQSIFLHDFSLFIFLLFCDRSRALLLNWSQATINSRRRSSARARFCLATGVDTQQSKSGEFILRCGFEGFDSEKRNRTLLTCHLIVKGLSLFVPRHRMNGVACRRPLRRPERAGLTARHVREISEGSTNRCSQRDVRRKHCERAFREEIEVGCVGFVSICVVSAKAVCL